MNVRYTVTSAVQSFPPVPGALTQFRVPDQQTNLDKIIRIHVNGKVQAASDTQPGRVTEVMANGK